MSKLKHSFILSGIGILLLAVIFFVVFPGHAGTLSPQKTQKIKEEKMENSQDYESMWKQVTQLIEKNLPKSALPIVEKIYQRAKADQNQGQIVKALIHKMLFIQEINENGFVEAQKQLLNALANSQFPETPLLHSMLAEMYWQFYASNRYRFLNRTPTSPDFNEDDILTWDLRKIVETVVFHYEKSLENPEKLGAVPVSTFDEVIVKGQTGRPLRPTLYDFLAHRAIDFYMNEEASLTTPRYTFTLNNPDYLLETEAFVKLDLTAKDSLSFKFHALKYLQDLIKFHLNDPSPNARIDVDLKRLKFVYQASTIAHKETLYEKTLLQMIDQYKNNPMVTDIDYDLAELYDALGNNYKPGVSEDFKWEKKKAHERCAIAIAAYPNSLGANNCRALIDRIESKNLLLTLEKATVKDKPFRGLLNYRNMNQTFFKVIPISREDTLRTQSMNTEDVVDYLLRKPAVQSWQSQIPDDNDFQNHSVEFKVDALKWGQYAVVAANTANFDSKRHAVTYSFITVSDIAYIHRRQDEKGLEIWVMDRETGQPLDNASAQVWYKTYNPTTRSYGDTKGQRLASDPNGYITIPYGSTKDTNFLLEFINGEDHLISGEAFNLYPPYTEETRRPLTVFFTDRAIYRPGQTVYFKGILMETDSKDGNRNKILTGRPTTVTLFDVNHQEVSKRTLTTNNYGTFSGSFVLPTGLLTGNMEIANESGATNFSMEEYKRPKFGVTFKPQEKGVRLNDQVTVTGKADAYAGYPIDNATVVYRVTREVFYPYPWFWGRYGGYFPVRQPAMEITNGTTTTDASGQFTLTFDAIPDLTIPRQSLPAFRFAIHADVTDINGETRSADQPIIIGYTSLKLSVNLPETLNKDDRTKTLAIDSTNLSGDAINASGTLSIYKLNEPNRILRNRLWEKPDKFIMDKKEFISYFPHDVYNDEDNVTQWEKGRRVFSKPFNTGQSKEITVSGLNQWETGKYVLEMQSVDDRGNKIEEIKYFTLYSGTGKQVPYKQLAWFAVIKGDAQPGETAAFLIGSSEKVRVLYEVELHGQIIHSEFLSLSNEQKRIELPIRDEHRGNIGVHVTFVRDNRLFMFSHNVLVPWSNKKLDISFGSFRSKLLPGEKEQWQIKIKGPGGENAAAEMVAALYDASLDAFRPHSWSFSIFPSHTLIADWYANLFFFTAPSYQAGKFAAESHYIQKEYDTLNWFGFYPALRLFRAMRDEMKLAAAPAAAAPPEKALKSMAKIDQALQQPPQAPVQAAPPTNIRKDFRETAFFYPHLMTSSDGEVTISFTIPDALTKWKMLGFAHTRNLEYGLITNELITQKDLMVVPNPPRFFREGDRMIFTSKITNLTENELSGTVKLELLDAETLQPVNTLFKNNAAQQSFKAAKGQSALAEWPLEIPVNEKVDAVIYRVTASAGKFSDGEEQTLPVLKNRILVTDTLSLPVSASQTRTFHFDKLIESATSTTIRSSKLTLEFTSNPVWYAVQAIPFLVEFPYECLEQVFSRYYGNNLASFIVNSNPQIKRVFDLWKNAVDPASPNANALLSNLEKNQELKSVLLEETPWVMEGKNESERKRRIALLFDLNTMAAQSENELRKLEDGQLPSGGWPWFKGMSENRFITQHIISGFGQLNARKVVNLNQNGRIKTMINKAIPYLDNEIRKDYERLIANKADLTKNQIGYIHVHYLYARSYFRDIPIDNRDQKAFDFYKAQAQTYWTSFNDNTYIEGMIALAMNRYKDTKTATAIATSIKEHALYSEEMGMYWKTPVGFYWYQMPIETQALLIEVFDEVLNDRASVEKMKTWLLKQKQTQDWGTTKATVEACYALLLKGEDWLKENQPPEITLGIKHPLTIEPGKTGPNGEQIAAEAGTGYFKVSWSGSDIQPEMGRVTIKNNNNVPAWGGMYWQYFENLDKITAAETPLKLSKKLFVEKPSDAGPVIHPIDNNTELKIGDRIKVRIELRVDRDMEYIHMKDMRASAFEPEDVLSAYKFQGGLGYYQATKDASTNFFIDYLGKGTYVFEYALRVTHNGDFTNGITTIQCMYAPEFSSHSEGIRVTIGKE
ncbi:MAG: alpha-2-macroglobulin family protein [Candidatus Omnitrophota bacterium]